MSDLSAAAVPLHGPYEDLAIESLKLIGKIIDTQPKEVQKELWDGYLADAKAWREFGVSIRKILGLA